MAGDWTKADLDRYAQVVQTVASRAFTLVEWIVVIVAIQFLGEQSGHWVLLAAGMGLKLFLLLYIQAMFLIQFTIRIFPARDNPDRARLLNEICSSVVGFVLYLGCWWFINVLISALKMLQQQT